NVYYYEDGYFHRLDGPAFEPISGDKCWYKYGKKHKDNGPAIEWRDGDKEWYINDNRHRIDGPAIEDYKYNTNHYYVDGEEVLPKLYIKDGVLYINTTLNNILT